jgi:hypothetical protein
MTNLLPLLLSLLAAMSTVSRSEYRDTRDDGTETRISVVHEEHEHYATFEKNGARYITRDASVLEELERALEHNSHGAREEARVAREEARIAREEAAIAREEARLAREEARLARDGADSEAARHRIEEKRRGIEEKRRDLERERREIEKKRADESNESLEAIFQRAVREGHAERQR